MAKKKIWGAFRCMYPTLTTPKAFSNKPNADGSMPEKKFSIQVLIPKSDKAALKAIDAMLVEAAEANGNMTAGKRKEALNIARVQKTELGLNKYCILKDGDLLNLARLEDDKQPYEGYAGHYVWTITRKEKDGTPYVVDRSAAEIIGAVNVETLIRAGYWVRVDAHAYAYSNKSTGIACQLNGVQFVKEDKVFGQANNFDAIEVDEESEESFAE